MKLHYFVKYIENIGYTPYNVFIINQTNGCLSTFDMGIPLYFKTELQLYHYMNNISTQKLEFNNVNE